MSLKGLVTPEPEIGGGSAGCAVAELHGQVILVHECRNQRGVFYKIISDGPVEVIAPEVRITGKLVLHGDLDVTGNVLVRRDDGCGGSVLAQLEVRAKNGLLPDPLLQF